MRTVEKAVGPSAFFRLPRMSVSPTTPDEELSDAAYCAKNSILGIGCRGKYFIALEMDPEI